MNIFAFSYVYPKSELIDHIERIDSMCEQILIPGERYDDTTIEDFMTGLEDYINECICAPFVVGLIFELLTYFLYYPHDEKCKNISYKGEMYVLSNFVRLNLKNYLNISDELQHRSSHSKKSSSYEIITSSNIFPQISDETNIGEALHMAYYTILDTYNLGKKPFGNCVNLIFQKVDDFCDEKILENNRRIFQLIEHVLIYPIINTQGG